MSHRLTILAAGLFAAISLAPSTVRADTVVVSPAEPAYVATTVETTSPNTPVIASGVVTFGISYGIAVAVAATSDNSADRRLYVPVLGPWLDLADRPSCPIENQQCDKTTTQKILIGADGVFQAVGVVVAIYGILTPRRHVVGGSNVQVVPARMGSDAHGLALTGSF